MVLALSFSKMAMDLDSLDVLPGYNLTKHSSTSRLARLRALMAEHGLDGYLIVDSDAHYTFYAQARQDRRINYITNSEVCSTPPVSIVDKHVGTMWCGYCWKGKGG